MKLVIIAGGNGTRLGLKNIPKSMVKIGDRPLLEHQILFAKKYGIKEIFILTGYLFNIIFDYFGNGEKLGVKITYISEPYPLGTAGSLKLLENIMHKKFMVFYGDLFIDIDLKKFIKASKNKYIANIIIQECTHYKESDLIQIDKKGFIRNIYLKPHSKYYNNCFNNAAIYIFHSSIFKYIRIGIKQEICNTVFKELLSKGNKIKTYKSNEYCEDIGTVERLKNVRKYLKKAKGY